MPNPFTPVTFTWGFFGNLRAEPIPEDSLVGEQGELVLGELGTGNSTILRLRILLYESGGDTGQNNISIGLEYDIDEGFSDPQAFGPSQAWDYYDGLGTEGNDTTSFLLETLPAAPPGSHLNGEYYESEGGAGTEDIGKGSYYEIDICFHATENVLENQTFYFRVTVNGTAIDYDGACGVIIVNTTTWPETAPQYTKFKTPITSNKLNWHWNSGQFNVTSGMCIISEIRDKWKWFVISSSSSHFYPSGIGDPPTKWKWVSGSQGT